MDEPYQLLPEDAEYLDAHYANRWRKVSEGVGKWGLVIEPFPLPDAYLPGQATLMLLIPSGYPGVPIDMFYLHPPVAKRSGGAIGALADEMHFGTVWQRWSRHYDWNPGEDNVTTHIEYVKNELETEAQR